MFKLSRKNTGKHVRRHYSSLDVNLKWFMGVWGRVGYAILSIDDRQFISGIYYWHGVGGDHNFTERRDNKLFHKYLQPNGQQLFPFGHNTRTDTAGCQVTLYICIYCVNGWMSCIYIDTSLHVFSKKYWIIYVSMLYMQVGCSTGKAGLTCRTSMSTRICRRATGLQLLYGASMDECCM